MTIRVEITKRYVRTVWDDARYIGRITLTTANSIRPYKRTTWPRRGTKLRRCKSFEDGIKKLTAEYVIWSLGQ